MIVEIDYTNWQGERSVRQIEPKKLLWGSNEWHPEEQWLLLAIDVAKKAPRTFAVKEIHAWRPFDTSVPHRVSLHELRSIYCYVPTPAKLAKRLVEVADIRNGMSVLEPSAGRGYIAQFFPERENVLCIDILKEHTEYLDSKGFQTICTDFLEYQPTNKVDRIVMGPPFKDGLDIKHVTHALDFLNPGGKLVALMHDKLRYDEEDPYASFREFVETNNGIIHALPPGSFLPESEVDAVVVILEK